MSDKKKIEGGTPCFTDEILLTEDELNALSAEEKAEMFVVPVAWRKAAFTSSCVLLTTGLCIAYVLQWKAIAAVCILMAYPPLTRTVTYSLLYRLCRHKRQ